MYPAIPAIVATTGSKYAPSWLVAIAASSRAVRQIIAVAVVAVLRGGILFAAYACAGGYFLPSRLISSITSGSALVDRVIGASFATSLAAMLA